MNPRDYRLFVDLDGVLVDFDAGVRRATGRDPAELHPRSMWPVLAKTRDFYANLDWMSDGRDLWDALRIFNPVILTGLPLGRWAEPQKRTWCNRELGTEVEVITGLSRHKADLAAAWMEERNETDRTPLLIDDRLKVREPWEAAGGTFILHLNTAETLDALADLGFPIS